jgi:hypothetical protein
MAGTRTPDDDRRGSAFGEVLRVRVELWLVVVFMALAFGAGIVVTAMYDEPAPVVGVQDTTGVIAPPLTDDQIAGGLPSGHPDLGAVTGATGATGVTGTGNGSGQNDGSGQGNDGGGK